MKKKYIAPQIIVINTDVSVLAAASPTTRTVASEDVNLDLPDGNVTPIGGSSSSSDNDDDDGGTAAKRRNIWTMEW
jgi:hypothetical protein